jgi:hypothetical protein
MAKAKTKAMMEHRVTLVVRFPLDGGAVPSLASTLERIEQLNETDPSQQDLTDAEYDALADAEIIVRKSEAVTVRVPIAEPAELTDDG